MKGLTVLMMTCAVALGLAGCRCRCQDGDGIHDGLNGVLAEYEGGPEDTVRQVYVYSASGQDETSDTQGVQANPNVYAYVPPVAEDAGINSPAVDAVVQEVSDGTVMGDGVGDAQFDSVYEDVMSVMDLEDIGTRSTYRIIR